MPKKKFGQDDVFFNTVKTHPQYTFSYYFNQSYINNRQTQGNRVQSGSVSLFELNVERESETPLIQPFFIKGEDNSLRSFKNVTGSQSAELTFKQYKALENGTKITSSYPLTSSISRERLIGSGGSSPYNGFQAPDGIASSGSVNKIIALQNTLNYNKIYSPKYDYSEYIISGEINGNASTIMGAANPYQPHMTLFCIPEIFKGERVKPGSVELNFYVTGTLLATAKDTKRNGELVETFGPRTDGCIGTISYKEGVMLITGNYTLDLGGTSDGYLCPVTGTETTIKGPNHVPLKAAWRDNPKWVHFGAYQSFITSSTDTTSGAYGPVSSSYEFKFEGTNTIPTLTMFCHAEKNEMNWSNNLTYLDRNFCSGATYHSMVVAATGSTFYSEIEELPVKNTISSSFANYSSSYQDQTFISKINIYDEDDILIGTAKLAKPVTKTNSTDYTFKLKIDI